MGNYREIIKELLHPDCEADVNTFSNEDLMRVHAFVEECHGQYITELKYVNTTDRKQEVSVEIMRGDGSQTGCVFVDSNQ